jgi:hypothetical protein
MPGSAGSCSRCSGVVEHSVAVCEDHDGTVGICEHCDWRYAVAFEVECATCHHSERGIAPTCRPARTEMLFILTDHGGHPLVPDTYDVEPKVLANYEEDVVSLGPFEAAFTFTTDDDDTLTVTVDDDVSIVAVRRGRPSE